MPDPSSPRIPRAPIVAATAVAAVGAGILALVLVVLTSTSGTFAISGAAGLAIGLLVSATAVARTPRSSGGVAPLTRSAAVRLSSGLAIGMVVLAAAVMWLVARAEGGVLDPVTYLWTIFGFGLPAQALVAVLAAAWGASAGPIRWRS
ncbi:MAG: hypothetical protein ABIQ17_00795 [Candidatus Limnocylindrales bacterium]